MAEDRGKKTTEVLTYVRLVPITRGDLTIPALIYTAKEAPAKGTKINVELDNGVTYTGVVHDATFVDGEALVELRDGLTPV